MTVEWNMTLLLKKSSLAVVRHQLHPQGSRPPNEGVTLRSILNDVRDLSYQLSKHLVCMFTPLVWNSKHHVRTNSRDFIYLFKFLWTGVKDIKVSLDMVSLFTRLTITVLNLLGKNLKENITALICHVLDSSYFYSQRCDDITALSCAH